MTATIFGVGVIGTGLIGARRAKIAAEDSRVRLVAVMDSDRARAETVAASHGCDAMTDGDALIQRKDIHIVVVGTSHKFLPIYSCAALKAGKHVLCEKPMGRNTDEIIRQVEAAQAARVYLKGGFNHRYHPAIRRAYELHTEGAIGEIILLRCRYGHGARPGYENEWRGNPELAGGGELLDQGIHAIDLFRMFAGDFSEVFGWTSTRVWNIAPLEDNAMALLKNRAGVMASVHASWTQWKNLFSFEIFGRDGYLVIEGLGGSYGVERLKVGRRRPQSGPPDESEFEFTGPDLSWNAEWDDFMSSVISGRTGGGEDSIAAMQLIDAIYVSMRENRPVHNERKR